MIVKRQKLKTVMGHKLAPQRLTAWAYSLGFLYVGIPFLGGLALLDILLTLIARYGFNTCYGLLCYL